MAQIDRSQIERALARKGFEREETHHTYFHHKHDGKYTGVYTYVSRGSKYKTYGRPLLARMKRELELDSVNELIQLLNCPMTQQAYDDKLKSKGKLE